MGSRHLIVRFALLELKSFYSVLSWESTDPTPIVRRETTERYWKDTKETLRSLPRELEMTPVKNTLLGT